jgi:hypothetical protein
VLVRDSVALLVFALAAMALMWPVLAQPRSVVLGPPGDNIQYVYMTGWVGQALLLGRNPLVDPRGGFPDNLALAATDAPFLAMAVVAPVTLLLGPLAGYNALFFLGHVLSGYFVYLWLVRLTGSRAAGIVAGLAFALAPFRHIHAAAHPQIASTQFLPLFFWALDSALTTQQLRSRHLWLLGAATFLVGAMSQYLLLICLVTGAAYAGFAMLEARGWRREARSESWLRTALASPGQLASRLTPLASLFAVTLLGALFAMLPYIANLGSGGYEAYHIARTRIWSAAPYHFVLPSQLHPLWGGLARTFDTDPRWGEKTLYLGLVTSVLAIVGLLWRNHPNRRRSLTWLGTAFVAAVLALGTDLHWGGEPVRVDDPFWLPAFYLAQLPGANIMRVWSRFGVVTILFVSLLAGLGTARLATWLAANKETIGLRAFVPACLRVPFLAASLAALIVLDFAPGSPGTLALAPRPIDQWLAAQPGDFAVAPLPAGNDVANYRNLFGSLLHGKHIPAFNHPYHLPRAFRDYANLARGFPDANAVWYLRKQGFAYAILERRFYTGQDYPPWSEVMQQIERTPGLRLVEEDIGGYAVVALNAR